MAVKVQVPKKASAVRFFLHPAGKALLAFVALGLTIGLAVFTYYYVKYSRLIEAKLTAGPYANTSMLFAAPRTVGVGDLASAQELATELRRSGYNESRNNRMGYYAIKPEEIDIYPGPDSYFKRDEGVVKFRGPKVSQIISLADNTERTEYTLEPELISNLFDKTREKRRLIRYEDIPPVLVHAVVSAEDKRFFQHSGFDPIRIIKAAWVDVRQQRYAQGASTLSQQLSRHSVAGQRQDLAAQDPRSAHHHAPRTEAFQRTDLRVLRQSGAAGQSRKFRYPRIRRSGPGLLRHRRHAA